MRCLKVLGVKGSGSWGDGCFEGVGGVLGVECLES